VKVAHEYLNKRSLVVASGPDGPPFRLHGGHTLLAGGEGTPPRGAGGRGVHTRTSTATAPSSSGCRE
jgi:hypothetical protein